MCPQLMAPGRSRARERWSGRSARTRVGCCRGGHLRGHQRFEGIRSTGSGPLGSTGMGLRTTALSVHSSMHTQHELMATEGLPGLSRRRGHGAEAKCWGRAFSGAVTHFQVRGRMVNIGDREWSGGFYPKSFCVIPLSWRNLATFNFFSQSRTTLARAARVPLSQPPAARTWAAAAARSYRPPTAAPPRPPGAGSPSCAPCPPPAPADAARE